MSAPLAPGAEPFSATGGELGVLVLHGFTGSPVSMRPIAECLADRGYTVELPLLPGHGTALEDLVPMRWSDWTGAAADAYDGLAARCRAVAVVALSMGGGLAAWLAEQRPTVAALALVNPLVMPVADELRQGGRDLLDAGVETLESIGNDIALEGADEHGYDAMPIAAAMSLMDGLEDVAASLGTITCPTLVLTSREDHVVSTDNSELVAAKVAGPVEHVWLERSYHVATLDHDAALVESETCRFLEAAFESA
ncbi:MAG TPA: alpha/beta fold hydrolase [Acidimicrobiales bacterium]|nr:alpha/beta fold hydrolase [Acidimicrobiales bacterium]